MTFYVKPPKGLTNINNLEESVRQRLLCYNHLKCENPKSIHAKILELNCLAEDTILDRLSHYIFRLVSLKSSRFSSFFIDKEVALLDFRLQSYGLADVKYVIKKLKKHASEALEAVEVNGRLQQFYLLFIRMCIQLLKKFKTPDEELNYAFKVPFDFCPNLVSSREYNLCNGFIYVYTFQWKNLFLSLYRTYLSIVLKEMSALYKVHLALEDDRIKSVILLTKSLFEQGTLESEQGSFKLESFDGEAKKFPPCMKHLYDVLKKTNRLSHNARFNFSLYLKGIGLSMGDALSFWEKTYSKQHASCSKCTHSWQDNERRYIYGIRHLYGLEGARKTYTVSSCQQIQDLSLTAMEEGGCPFRHFDDKNLREILNTYQSINVEVIMSRRQESPKGACELLFAEHARQNQFSFQDPAQYYLLMK